MRPSPRKKIVHIAARLGDQQDSGKTIPRMDMVLDKAVAPAGGDISERERAGAGPRRRGAGGGDPTEKVDELLGARARVPADLDPRNWRVRSRPTHASARH